MKVRFKGVDNAYTCTEPVEQKLFQSGKAIGWAVMFHIHGNVSSSDIDDLITPESISELVFISEDEENPRSITLSGYSGIRACTIRHRAGTTVTEIQLTKANELEAATGEEATTNG